MRIWVVTVGEPLPTDPGGQRLHRAGILARRLVRCGHEVLWWTATFDHSHKRQRFARSTPVADGAGLAMCCLHGRPYRRSVSLARLVNHWQIAREFGRLAPAEVAPDIVIAAMPTIELARRAVIYGRRRGVPTVIDVRDLWPDIWVEVVPAPLRPAARLALWPYDRMLRAALRGADAVTGFTDGAVDWALAKIARARRPADASFPLGYEADPPPAAEIADAEAFWDGLGVGAGDGRFVACFVGSLGRRLPLHRLVDAAALVPEAARSSVRFVICGDGEARAELAARAGGLDHVLLPGWVNRAQIWALLRRSSVGLLPYPRTIDFLRSVPNKAAEYLSGGLPIVTSMGGEMAALIARTGCGLALAEETAEALAGAVLRLARDPAELARLRDRAAAAFPELTAEVVYGRMVDHLVALARPPAAPAPSAGTLAGGPMSGVLAS